MEVEGEGDKGIEHIRSDLEVHHESALPIAQEERPSLLLDPLAGSSAFVTDLDRRRSRSHHATTRSARGSEGITGLLSRSAGTDSPFHDRASR